MDYKEKYEEALETVQEILDSGADSIKLSRLKLRLQSVFPELKEDDKIRRCISDIVRKYGVEFATGTITKEKMLAWLEKYGRNIKFLKSIQIGDEVTRNSDSVLVNLSQLKRVVDEGEKQGEQESTNKVEPKFKVGDWIVQNGVGIYKIVEVCESWYEVISYNNEIGIQYSIGFDKENDCHLWTIQDAKDGDVLVGHECYVIFKEINGLNIRCHCTYHYIGYNPSFYVETLQNKTAFHPATKEQRVLLFSKMKEAGYKWDSEKKELINMSDKKQ